MEPAFDARVAAWLAQRALDPTESAPGVAGARLHARAVGEKSRALLADPSPAASETDATVPPGTRGTPGTPVRVLRPHGDRPRPTVVFCHGGGWLGGDLDTHLQHARRLCAGLGAVVVSVGYRLAPEHPYPAAFDDCLSVTRRVAADIGEYGGDPARLVVAGDSAGGQLAASVAIACRDLGVALAGQLLIVPATDLAGGYASDTVNARYPSRARCGEGYGLTTEAMAWFADVYGAGEAAGDWRVSPLRAGDLRGVAPAVVHTAGYDPLRDEGAAYAGALRDAGVAVAHRDWPTLNHGYFSLGGVSATAERAAAQAVADMRRLVFPGAKGA
ncbi:alpha/beta hydrolase [Streptomyces sp. NRRL F-5126]|uniref:alpha/beta hydrolase n=1 Tax=Streptomyces sp. NRRL F-5126 TaxID=1463857 RepID=UPI0006913FA3|nr:alpha/beta hydrolase [Streptomyces sp. NRRL F-5126]